MMNSEEFPQFLNELRAAYDLPTEFEKGALVSPSAVVDLAKRQQRQLSKRRKRWLTPSNPFRIVHGQHSPRFWEITRIG
jgi:hypothetical protein